MIPRAIADAFRALMQSGLASISGELVPCAATGGIQFTCALPVPQPNPEGLPPAARFSVTMRSGFPDGKLDIVALDAEVQGFAHQAIDGTICLDPKETYPSSAPERLVAYVKDAIGWVADAAHRRLLEPDQPWELPDFRMEGKYGNSPPLYFLESSVTLPRWIDRVGESGQVDLADHRAARGVVAVRFYRQGGAVAMPAISTGFCDTTRSTPSEWLLLDSFIVERHRRPRTFGELEELGERIGVDVWQPLHLALKRPSVGGHRYLLVGAPIPKRVGQPVVEVHWQPIAIPDSVAREILVGSTMKGGEIRRDRLKLALRERVIPWGTAHNVADERLLVRGALRSEARQLRICILGCGAVGAPLAEHLARGGAHKLSLFDRATLEFPKLGRHVLYPIDVGNNKALAHARRLAGIHPDAQITGFPWPLPLDDVKSTREARAALDVADVIIDCTANETVLRWVSQRRRQGTLVISMYTNAGASILSIVAAGRHASCLRVDNALHADVRAGALPCSLDEYDPPLEEIEPGVGCWSPTYPARGSDIAMLVAAAVPLLEQLVARERQSHGTALVLRRRAPDASLEPGPLVELLWKRDYR